jgi:3'(2'), 5'-bisphosphate nucleotidase
VINFLNNAQIKNIFDIAISAGEQASSAFYAQDFTIKIKKDNSQVTSIDLQLSKFISENLSKLFPQIPIICEEGDKLKILGDYFFVVDPIDGTASFINGEEEFSINIALIYKQKPIFGLIYAPLFEGGKMIFNDEKNQVYHYHHELNREQIIIRPKLDNDLLSIISSRRLADEIIANFMKENFLQYGNYNISKFSSAVKFIIMAEGRANLYLHLRRSMEWDIASGQILLELLGGKFNIVENINDQLHISQQTLLYGKDDFVNPFFIVSFL